MLPTQVFVTSAQTRLRMRSWFPPFANCAQDGAPAVLVIPAKSKAWATPPILFLLVSHGGLFQHP